MNQLKKDILIVAICGVTGFIGAKTLIHMGAKPIQPVAQEDLIIPDIELITIPEEQPQLPSQEEMQKVIEEKQKEEEVKRKAEEEAARKKAEEEKRKQTITNQSVTSSPQAYTLASFRKMGVIRWGGHRWTYYSEKVLPGKGLKIPGRHVDSVGFVCDGNGYICLASCDYSKGTVLDTPFGRKGKVYDYCPTSGTVDVYIH